MDYLYENLGHERFQEFCSCLIAKEFPDTQTFPVGQRDGGRDGLVYFMNSTKKEFFVFQVKYVRNPKKEIDIHKWFTEIIKEEAPKIERLIPRGAKRFYLLTNVSGTSFLDAGSMDKVNKILEENIKIPSMCWWRDDLSTLFEKDPLFKWSFSEILNGQDILNSILFRHFNESKEKRENLIRAYLADQYEIDNEVKFKQIELQNNLFELFVDVPIRTKKINRKNRKLNYALSKLNLNDENHFLFNTFEERETVGAASFILNPIVQEEIGKILLEGGPGQGKSTISQYVCQVHRIKLLNKSEDFSKVPEKLFNIPLRLPLKIDLRDLATWLEKKNPYLGTISEEFFMKIWQNSLESFLVGHICYHSKIDDISTSDLIAIFKFSSILLVFDGFDEIGDLNLREKIVNLINSGLNRLNENSKSIQVLITSRPAAFSNSKGFSSNIFPHFELDNVTQGITEEYIEKWITARKLRTREANEIRRLASEKLQLPHLKDLAKSPMQLAILISLLNTRGESLPNKRTALYDNYIDLFFNRESEKNALIRDKRELIIDIHKYLAWILHSEAEMKKGSGRIEIVKLKSELTSYLEKEGHNTEITDRLFTVMEERVCALVSRVQGTFEFEVQPLREYFCARYLYDTSPYSPAGNEKKGTLPDRFDALSKNFYWQNVLRFFAGCFSRGQLPLLIQKIHELNSDPYFKFTNVPRIITSQLLSDWVFTQYPRLLKQVIEIIINGLNIGALFSQNLNRNRGDAISLPEECGRKELVEECFKQLKLFPENDYATELLNLINNNYFETLDYWIDHSQSLENKNISKWLDYGLKLRILHKIEKNFLIELINNDDKLSFDRIQIIIRSGRFDLIHSNFKVKAMTLEGILTSNLYCHSKIKESNGLSSLSFILNPFLLSTLMGDKYGETYSLGETIINRFVGHREVEPEDFFKLTSINDDIDKKINSFFSLVFESINLPLSYWRTTIAPWEMIIDSGVEIFGENHVFKLISVIAAGIHSKEEKYLDFDSLNDENLSLCKRVRCARLKSGNVRWWESIFAEGKNFDFNVLIFLTWSTPKTLVKLFPVISDNLERLNEEELILLIKNLNATTNVTKLTTTQVRFILKNLNLNKLSETCKFILSLRFAKQERHQFNLSNLKNYNGTLSEILQYKFNSVFKEFIKNPNDLNLLKEVKKLYPITRQIDDYSFSLRRHLRHNEIQIPYNIAKIIMEDCTKYPRLLVSLAETSCRRHANETIVPVGAIAKNESWFD